MNPICPTCPIFGDHCYNTEIFKAMPCDMNTRINLCYDLVTNATDHAMEVCLVPVVALVDWSSVYIIVTVWDIQCSKQVNL